MSEFLIAISGPIISLGAAFFLGYKYRWSIEKSSVKKDRQRIVNALKEAEREQERMWGDLAIDADKVIKIVNQE